MKSIELLKKYEVMKIDNITGGLEYKVHERRDTVQPGSNAANDELLICLQENLPPGLCDAPACWDDLVDCGGRSLWY